MIVPGVMAIVAPLAVGIILGPEALGGMLAGALAIRRTAGSDDG